MRKWGFIHQAGSRKLIVLRKDLAEEIIDFVQEEGGGRLKLARKSYVPMIAARFARYPDAEIFALGKKHGAGRVLLTELALEEGPASEAACYVVAPESSYPLSATEQSALKELAAKELRDTTQDRAEAALYGVVVILAAIYFFW